MAWSLKEISLPTGAKIEIDYEEDDYWMEAFARRYWQEDLMFRFIRQGSKVIIEIKNEENNLTEDVNFLNYFTPNRDVFFDIWACARHDYHKLFKGCLKKVANVDISAKALKVSSVTQKMLVLEANFSTYVNESNGNPLFNRWVGMKYHPGFIFGSNKHGECSNPKGCDYTTDRLNLLYKLLANNIPENEMGGGLRVKELKTVSGPNTYKVQYDYNHPTEHRSSGITSYAPVDGLKYVPYQSELPAPGVMYEYVTMKETSNTGDYYSKTRYRHHVLKPVLDIFNPNIKMNALDANAVGEDRIFWANVTDNYGGLNGNNARKVSAKKVDISVNTALIGQLKSIEKLNREGHVMMKTAHQYINGEYLNEPIVNNRTNPDYEPNKGYVKETFNSMKSVFETSNDGKTIQDVKRLLSISSRTDYNNMLKKTTTHAGGQTTSITYSNVDPWLGSFRESITTRADGLQVKSYRIPAYEKYPAMGSKVLNPNNKNMLTQEAMTKTYLQHASRNWDEIEVGITTWNNDWDYTNIDGTSGATVPTSQRIWRKHKTFVWDGAVNYDGTLSGFSGEDDNFQWGINATQTNPDWKNVSTISMYDHYSMPLEVRDINNNYATTKMTDGDSKVSFVCNARYGESFYTGAESNPVGSYLDQQIKMKDNTSVSNTYAHTGTKSIKIPNGSYLNIEFKYPYHRTGKYKVSVWVKKDNAANTRIGFVSAPNAFNGEKVYAGEWVQLNHYLDINQTSYIYITSASGTIYMDDVRVHPVSSSMTSYVYNDWDELSHIIANNGLATKYEYDSAGRLTKTYTEVADFEGAGSGGFKLTNENEYIYMGSNNN